MLARLLAALLLLPPGAVMAETASYDEPSLDRWMYGANATPGRRGQASVFADPGDWTRLGQFMVGFGTAPLVPAGEGAERYQVSSVRLILITSGEPSFVFDDSYDDVSSYAGSDSDPGRPIELHGVGYRNDYTGSDFEQSSTPLTGEGGRNAYPLSWDVEGLAVDVSSNVSEGFESAPWAIGSVVGVNPGSAVAEEREVHFELDLTDPGVLGYVQESLDAGGLYLMVSSLQAAAQQGGTFVNFYTVDSQEHFFFGGYAPRLEIEYEIGDPPPVELPALEVLAVRMVEGSLELEWNQDAGQTYTVETSIDGGTWQAVSSAVAAADGTGTYSAPASAGRGVFRVRRTNG